jgi:hypothetical protein
MEALEFFHWTLAYVPSKRRAFARVYLGAGFEG